MEKYKCKIRLLEPMLGTCPKQKDIYKKFIAAKVSEAQGEEEAESIQESEDKGWTSYHKDDAGYFLFDYALKGFLCESARTLKQWGAMKQLQDKFKRYVFVTPRKIRLPEIDAEPLERPLRAQTAQGPRVTLVRSDQIAAGTELNFEIVVTPDGSGITEELIKQVLEYGQFMGLNQWRSGGYGRFEVVEFGEPKAKKVKKAKVVEADVEPEE